MGILYIVSTPIGNLGDISSRAVEVLTTVDIVACEDTRKTGSLLKMLVNHPSYHTQKERAMLVSYYEQNEFQQIPKLVNALKNGLSVALVSDAGTPAVSDPGYRLVLACLEEGIAVRPVPGASSVMAALVVSGLPTDKFLFLGYLPKKKGHRVKMLESAKSVGMLADNIHPTIILFEAPHKLQTTLEEMLEVLGDIRIVLCRELTKVYEEVRREKISEAITHYKKTEPKGEFVVLFNLHMSRDSQ